MSNVRDSRRGSSLGRLLPAVLPAMLMAALTPLQAGCGDGPICQAEALVIIQSSGTVLADSNLDMDGVQTDIRVRTTLGEDVEVVLAVRDEDGDELDTITATTDENGDVTFEDVTLPPEAASLHAYADAGVCGDDDDEIQLDISAGRDCELEIRQEPLDIDFYAPLGVLNLSNDDDPDAPNFQADIDVTTQPGYDVELFVIGGDTGIETSAGTETAGDGGTATFAISLAQGRQAVRAVCTASSGTVSSPSLTTSVYVDTVGPDCTMVDPAPGTTITPALDTNDDLSDGVQLELEAHAEGDDVELEEADFVVTVGGTSDQIAGSDLDDLGDSYADATVDPATVPSTATVRFSTQDHAENGCETTEIYDVVYDGCDIVVASPTTTVAVDADGNAANGMQVDVLIETDIACAGRTITSDCGLDNPTGVVAANGSLLLEVDMCAGAICDVTDACTFTVSTASGIETSAGASIHFDNQPPPVGVQISQPALACGAQVTPAVDVQPAVAGVQITVRVVSPTAADRQLEITGPGGVQTVSANGGGGDVIVTIQNGTTSFVGIASDSFGNSSRTGPCAVTMAEIVVSYLPPAADGAVGASDGIVAGSNLTFTLTGRTSTSGASVSVVVDGAPAIPAIVSGSDWSVSLTLGTTPAPHVIVATATAGPLSGQATLNLTVDLSAPDTIANLVVIADTRQSLEASWLAPSDGGAPVTGYIVKVATVALTEGNFDSTGEQVFTGTPLPPGGPEVLDIAPRRTGTQYWVGVAATDSGGNRGPAAIVGPVTPRFDQTAAIPPPDTTGAALFGLAIARGKFNSDELWDVAVSAPGVDVAGVEGAGAVYVYYGSATGIASTPDVTITSAAPVLFGSLGLSLTAVRWSSTTRDDLVIGEPYSSNQDGRVHVFHGGSAFVAGDRTTAEAELSIGVNPVPNYFTGGGLGWSLAALNFDGDARTDLAIGTAVGGGGNGGVVIIYGGTVTQDLVLLSDADVSQLGGAVVHLLDDPDPAPSDIFGNYLFNVGRTQGGADQTDDLLISYADGKNRAFIYRGRTSRPSATGVHARGFQIGNDVRFDYVAADGQIELASSGGSIPDLNGDGARDVVMGAYRAGADTGEILIVDGNTLGTGGIASTVSPGVVVTTLSAAAGTTFAGASIVNNATAPGADVDGDGFEDLIVSARVAGIGSLLVWFGGSIPTGTALTSTAQHVITGPSTFNGGVPGFGGTPHAASWAGDVNGDGLTDICWGDNTGNSSDGSIQVLWDDGN